MIPPTDLELMMYHDGELSEPRQSEVRAFVEADDTAGKKLFGLSLVGAAVRESLRDLPAPKPSITADVMAAIEADANEEEEPAREDAPKKAAGLKIGLDRAAAAPANDNGRFIFALAAFAAAAAAALFIWGRSPAGDSPTARDASNADATSVAEELETSPPPEAQAPVAERPIEATAPAPVAALTGSAATPDSDEEDAPRSVEVASVDFGSRSGAIYYVSGDNKPTSTTVVWVRDE